jgi:cytochrome c-type protein NapC
LAFFTVLGFNTAIEILNTQQFAIGCHEMRDNLFVELNTNINPCNASGACATCPDSHLPHQGTDKVARKMQAAKEVWGALFSTINTREKFNTKRLELANHECARLKSNDSLQCRNCHGFKYMNLSRQNPRAEKSHETGLATQGKTSIDCR